MRGKQGHESEKEGRGGYEVSLSARIRDTVSLREAALSVSVYYSVFENEGSGQNL